MGFSTSAVMVIFSISLIYMASIFYPLAAMSRHEVSEAEKYSNGLWKEKLNTKITITNWAGNNLTVFNNGSITLNSSRISVILNGVWKSDYTVSPEGVWPPGTSIDVNIGTGSGRVKIIAANGAADYLAT